MPIAYSYLRFSSARQEQGDSLRRQEQLAETYAQKHNLQLNTTLTYRDLGVSAFKGAQLEKGALGSFVRAIDEGIVASGSYLLVENLDRLSRQEVDVALEFFLSITRKGIIIVTLDDDMVYSSENIRANWTKLIVALAIMAGAHEQSLNKARRIGEAWENKRANAATKRLTKMCPDWLRPTENGWEVIEEKAAGVRRVFELYAEGYGKASLAKILNQEQVPALSNAGWHPNTVQKLLSSRTVLGEFQAYTGRHPNRVPAGDPVPNYYPPIVGEDLWLRSQRPKKSGGGRGFKEMVNVFRGLLRCPICNGAVTIYTSTLKGVSRRSLGCYNYQRGMCIVKPKWRYEEFLKLFITFVREVNLDVLLDNRAAIDSARKVLNSLEMDGRKLEKQIDNVASSISDDPSPTLNRLLRSLEGQQAALQLQILAAETDLATKAIGAGTFKRDLQLALQHLEQPEQRVRLNLLLRQLVERIDVYLGGFDFSTLGIPVPKQFTGLSHEKRFMIIRFSNGSARGINADGTSTVLDHEGLKPDTWMGKAWPTFSDDELRQASVSRLEKMAKDAGLS